MGWETEVIIIGEGIESKDLCIKIGNDIFEKDSKRYGKENFYIASSNLGYSIYYTYERSKYAPYWIIEEISKVHTNISFTVLGSMLECITGPAGIIRIKNGEIIDSYGIWYSDQQEKRYEILDSPVKNKEIIFEWFKTTGLESKLRSKLLHDFPFDSCTDNFLNKIIPIDENQFNINSEQRIDWIIQPNFSLSLPFAEYSKIPLGKMEINEKNFISFIKYNEVVNDIDKKVIEVLNGEALTGGLLYLFHITFGDHSSNNDVFKKRYRNILDLENDLKKYSKEILKWGIDNFNNEKKLRLCKGFSIKWLMEIIKSDRITCS